MEPRSNRALNSFETLTDVKWVIHYLTSNLFQYLQIIAIVDFSLDQLDNGFLPLHFSVLAFSANLRLIGVDFPFVFFFRRNIVFQTARTFNLQTATSKKPPFLNGTFHGKKYGNKCTYANSN